MGKLSWISCQQLSWASCLSSFKSVCPCSFIISISPEQLPRPRHIACYFYALWVREAFKKQKKTKNVKFFTMGGGGGVWPTKFYISKSREKFSFETERHTERQVYLLSCAFAANKNCEKGGTHIHTWWGPKWKFLSCFYFFYNEPFP